MNTKPGVLKITIIGAAYLIVSAGGGYLLNEHIKQEALTAVLKYLIGVIGIVWFFSMTVYNKLSDLTDISGLDFRQHRNIEVEIRSRLHSFWLRAVFIGFLAFAMYFPSILSSANVPTPDVVICLAFGAFGLSIFSLRCLWSELEEIRELKSYIKELERREKDRADQVKAHKEASATAWEADPSLDNFRDGDNNKE